MCVTGIMNKWKWSLMNDEESNAQWLVAVTGLEGAHCVASPSLP